MPSYPTSSVPWRVPQLALRLSVGVLATLRACPIILWFSEDIVAFVLEVVRHLSCPDLLCTPGSAAGAGPFPRGLAWLPSYLPVQTKWMAGFMP